MVSAAETPSSHRLTVAWAMSSFAPSLSAVYKQRISRGPTISTTEGDFMWLASQNNRSPDAVPKEMNAGVGPFSD